MKKTVFSCFVFLFIFTAVLTLSAPSQVLAEEFEAPEYGFSINPSDDWKIVSQNFQGGLVSYYKEGTTALFHVTVRDVEEGKSAETLEWKDLFHPQFEEILIGTDGETTIGGEKAKYCVYRIRSGAFKKKMEGKIPAKYINYVIARNGKLFSITFVDTLDHFSLDYSSFLKAVRTIQFGAPQRVVGVDETEEVELVFKTPPEKGVR